MNTSTDSYQRDPVAQALAADPMLALRGNVAAAIEAESCRASCSSMNIAIFRHETRGQAFKECLAMIDTHIAAAKTQAIHRPAAPRAEPLSPYAALPTPDGSPIMFGLAIIAGAIVIGIAIGFAIGRCL